MAVANLSFTVVPSALTITSVIVASTGADVSGDCSLSGSGFYWALTINEPAPALVYLYTLSGTFDGVPSPVTGNVVGTLAVPTSIYPNVYQGLLNKYGTNNIANWSNKGNNNTSIDLPSVQNAIAAMEDAFNNFWSNGPYVVPLTNPTPQVVDWVVTMCAWWLYLNRGFSEQDSTGMKLDKEYNAAMSQMGMYKGVTSMFVLPCARRWPSPTAAVAVGRFGRFGGLR